MKCSRCEVEFEREVKNFCGAALRRRWNPMKICKKCLEETRQGIEK